MRQTWRHRYVHIAGFAMQQRRFVYHSLRDEGPYSPPPCMGRTGSHAILALREHVELIPGARPCARCHSASPEQEPRT